MKAVLLELDENVATLGLGFAFNDAAVSADFVFAVVVLGHVGGDWEVPVVFSRKYLTATCVRVDHA